VVVAPHLDDAALSLGATIAHTARAGARVTVLTVFAGDPAAVGPAGVWDALCGFATAGEAAAARRREDALACEILGAEPVWLPFPYGDYASARDADSIWEAVAPELAGADLVLVPGHPLGHRDHAWLAALVASRSDARLGLYVEQPYANLAAIPRGHTSLAALLAVSSLALRTPHARARLRPAPPADLAALLPGGVEWRTSPASHRDRRAKFEAIAAYASQVSRLGRRLLPRIRLYEWSWGGEGVGFVSDPNPLAGRR
jgi:LmbE family N-acetylglucosaminyl deacetylase